MVEDITAKPKEETQVFFNQILKEYSKEADGESEETESPKGRISSPTLLTQVYYICMRDQIKILNNNNDYKIKRSETFYSLHCLNIELQLIYYAGEKLLEQS